jgi:hypothetical protein
MLKSPLYYGIIFSLLLACLGTQAQITNIEKFRLDKDTANIWMGNISFGFSNKKQKNTVAELNSGLHMVYLSKRHSYMTINYLNLQKVNQVEVISEGYTHWRANFWRKNIVSYEPFIQFQYDRGRGLQHRHLYGLAFRLNTLQYSKVKYKAEVAVSTGAMYEDEVWRGEVLHHGIEGDSTRAVTRFFKNTSNVSFRIRLHEKITYHGIVYYQARFARLDQPRIITDMQLIFKVTRILSLSSDFTSTYDSRPVVEGNIFTYKLAGSFIIKIN